MFKVKSHFLEHAGAELIVQGFRAYVWHDAANSPFKRLALCVFSDKSEADHYAHALNDLFGHDNPKNLYPFPSPCFRAYWLGGYGKYRLALNPLLSDGTGWHHRSGRHQVHPQGLVSVPDGGRSQAASFFSVRLTWLLYCRPTFSNSTTLGAKGLHSMKAFRLKK